MKDEQTTPLDEVPLRERTGEELAQPFKDRAQQSRERRKKRVTSQDILAQREAKRLDSETKTATDAKRGSRVRIGSGVALLVLAGASIVTAQSMSDQGQHVGAENAAVIQSLNSQIAALSSATGEGEVNAGQAPKAQSQIDAARTRAVQVAEGQNEFAALLAANPEDPGNGAPSQGFVDAVAHRADMAEYFTEATFVIDDEELYSTTSHLTLDPDEIDPRMQWYERSLASGNYTWDVASVELNKDGLTTDVTWLAQDSATDDLLAWATGTFSGDADTFITLTVGTTALGDESSALNALTPEQPADATIAQTETKE